MKKLITVAGVLFIMAFSFSSCIFHHHHGYHYKHGGGWHDFGPRG